MQWADIKNKYPDKFILIGNIVEEKIDDSKLLSQNMVGLNNFNRL